MIREARVTGCRQDGDDALIVDRNLLAAAELLPLERIQVHNVTRGLSFTVRCAAGSPGGNEVVCGGDVTRFASAGDLLTITAAAWLDREDVPHHRARIVLLDHDNRVRTVIERTPFDIEG